MTVNELITCLEKCKNKDAVVVLSHYEYIDSTLHFLYDASIEDTGNGVIGNVELRLDDNSDIYQALY